MKQEDKELLLKDLCERLLYNVKAEITAHNLDYEEDFGKVVIADVMGIQTAKYDDENLFYCVITCYDKYKTQGNDVENIKPYLRPMSSMTEEEKKKCSNLYHLDWVRHAFTKDEHSGYERGLDTIAFYQHIDYLNSQHLDYRDLIEKGLALEAPEGMYKTE